MKAICLCWVKGNLLILSSSFSDMNCTEGTIHLVGGDGSNGRILYCHHSSWYSLCADNWHLFNREARVICNTVGHDDVIPPFTSFKTNRHGKLYNCSFTFEVDIVIDSVVVNYGQGTNPILEFNIECSSYNTIISDCSTSYYYLSTGQCNQVAGVDCEGTPYREREVE